MKIKATDTNKIFTNHILVSRMHKELSKVDYEHNNHAFKMGKRFELTVCQGGLIYRWSTWP